MSPTTQRLLLPGGLVCALLAATALARPAHPDLWAQVIFDWLHVPVFGLIAVCLFAMTPLRWHWRQRLLVSAIATVMLGIATEAIQTLQPARSASAHDLGSDLIGATAFLCLMAAFMPAIPATRNARIVLMVVPAALIGWSLSQPATIFLAYVERHQQVPSIAPLSSRKSRLFFDLHNATVRYIDGPNEQEITPEFLLRAEGSASVDFHDPWPDWRGFETLVVDISNLSDAELSLTIRIHDREHLRGDQPGSDRFRRRLSLAPGRQRVTFLLKEIADAPASRSMNLGRIDGIVIYRSGQGDGRRFLLHDIRLE